MKKGFTLIELLSVIIILAVIALIATPVVLNVIEKSRKEALKDSAYGLVNSARFYYLENGVKGTVRFDINDSVVTGTTPNKMTFQGEIENGVVLINSKGETALCVNKGEYSVYKNFKDTNVILVDNKNCDIPTGYSIVYLAGESTIVEYTNQELTQIVQDLQSEIETLKSNGGTGGSNPAGTVISYMGNNVPTGYLSCDGTVYNINDYPVLAEQIKTEFGSYNYFGGDGVTTFAVPDLRGEFLRGTGTNSHENQGSGADVGVHQNGTSNLIQQGYHDSHHVGIPWNTEPPMLDLLATSDSYSVVTSTAKRAKEAVAEQAGVPYYSYTSRPTNTSVLYCIKY